MYITAMIVAGAIKSISATLPYNREIPSIECEVVKRKDAFFLVFRNISDSPRYVYARRWAFVIEARDKKGTLVSDETYYRKHSDFTLSNDSYWVVLQYKLSEYAIPITIYQKNGALNNLANVDRVSAKLSNDYLVPQVPSWLKKIRHVKPGVHYFIDWKGNDVAWPHTIASMFLSRKSKSQNTFL